MKQQAKVKIRTCTVRFEVQTLRCVRDKKKEAKKGSEIVLRIVANKLTLSCCIA